MNRRRLRSAVTVPLSFTCTVNMYSTDVIVFNPGLLSLAVQPFKAKDQLFVVAENIFTSMFKCIHVS